MRISKPGSLTTPGHHSSTSPDEKLIIFLGKHKPFYMQIIIILQVILRIILLMNITKASKFTYMKRDIFGSVYIGKVGTKQRTIYSSENRTGK